MNTATTFKRIGVIGAGVMGIGLAQNLAQTNHQVVLVDVTTSALEQAKTKIQQNVRFAKLLNAKAGKDAPVLPASAITDPAAVLGQITFTTDYALLHDVDFVVENTVEKWEIKKEVYPKLDAICPEPCIFAANTSCLSITRIGSVTKRPDRILGMHFMNPVPMKPVVEAIRGYHTSEATIATAKAFLAGMDKECIVVNDSPGFVTNRVLMLTVNEAIFLVHEQVAPAQEIDQLFQRCFGHKMGPLETADLIGLDTILYSIEVLYESFNDSKYRPCPLLKKMVDAGLYGRKSGQGFYKY